MNQGILNNVYCNNPIDPYKRAGSQRGDTYFQSAKVEMFLL